MKKLGVLLVGFMLFIFAGPANATTLDFNDQSNLGVTTSVRMQWSGIGGGHLYMNSYASEHSIFFDTNTYVNSFQMNYDPWENYTGNNQPNGWPVTISAYDSANSLVWNTQVNLISTFNDWINWITVSVETSNITKMVFGMTGSTSEPGYWPSIDNMVINENGPAQTPEPTTILLLGFGLLGVAGVSRKKK